MWYSNILRFLRTESIEITQFWDKNVSTEKRDFIKLFSSPLYRLLSYSLKAFKLLNGTYILREKFFKLILFNALAIFQMFNRAKCGEGGISAIPTVIWTAGAAALAHCLVSALFRRFMFRRVPLWEVILQYLLFIWMVIYSIHFWVITVNFLKFVIEYCYEPDGDALSEEEVNGSYFMHQWAAWLWSLVPTAVFIHARADHTTPPLMIWITRSPWQRREMGAYGYYLNRPISSLQTPLESARVRALTLRKAFSDSRTIIKEPTRKRRNSKSI